MGAVAKDNYVMAGASQAALVRCWEPVSIKALRASYPKMRP